MKRGAPLSLFSRVDFIDELLNSRGGSLGWAGGIQGFEHPGEEETLKGVCGVRARGDLGAVMNDVAGGVKHRRPLVEAEPLLWIIIILFFSFWKGIKYIFWKILNIITDITYFSVNYLHAVSS